MLSVLSVECSRCESQDSTVGWKRLSQLVFSDSIDTTVTHRRQYIYSALSSDTNQSWVLIN